MTLAVAALIIFVAAYVLVIGEETLELKKSKPVVLAAGLIFPHHACGKMHLARGHSRGQRTAGG